MATVEECPHCGGVNGYRSVLILRDSRVGSWGESCEGVSLSVARNESESVTCSECGKRVERLIATGRPPRTIGDLA